MSVYSIVKEEKNKIILDFFVCESFLQFFSQYYIGRIIDWRKIMEEFGYCKNCNEYVPCTIRNKVHIEWYKGEKIVSAKYCYITHELRLHQNDRCKRFTPV